MNFLKALKNNLRCLFCRESYCHVKYSVGSRRWISSDIDSGAGGYYVGTTCPKNRREYKNAKERKEEILAKNKK